MEILYSNKTDELIESLRITISETRFIFFFYFLVNPGLKSFYLTNISTFMTQIRKLVNDVIYMYMMLFSTIWFNQTQKPYSLGHVDNRVASRYNMLLV